MLHERLNQDVFFLPRPALTIWGILKQKKQTSKDEQP
jgi:hypothetical protein